MVDVKQRGLGRGLNALFEDDEPVYAPNDGGVESGGESPAGRSKSMMGVEQLVPGASQPRTVFDDDAIAELAQSIESHGVLQPLLVRSKADTNQYEIIAGERRWRAAQKVQLHEVPVIILDIADEEAFEIALVENLQREDLSPIEEAQGYQRLMKDYGHTQEKLGALLGKSRSHIANMVRLLGLPEVVLGYLESGELSMGHARALLPTKEPEKLAKFVIKEGLTVRQAEALALEDQGKAKAKKPPSQSYHKDADTVALENDLSSILGMRVTINSNDKGAGSVQVLFKSLDQLDNLIHRLTQFPKVVDLEHNSNLPIGPDNPPPRVGTRLMD